MITIIAVSIVIAYTAYKFHQKERRLRNFKDKNFRLDPGWDERYSQEGRRLMQEMHPIVRFFVSRHPMPQTIAFFWIGLAILLWPIIAIADLDPGYYVCRGLPFGRTAVEVDEYAGALGYDEGFLRVPWLGALFPSAYQCVKVEPCSHDRHPAWCGSRDHDDYLRIEKVKF